MKVGDEQYNALIAAVGRRVAEMKAELPADGTLPLPFRCYGCDRKKYDFRMMTGDGLPLCGECFDGCVDAASGKGTPS